MFKKGDKVVCSSLPFPNPCSSLKVGERYTIVQVIRGQVSLKEIGPNDFFFASRFKKRNDDDGEE
jgi:hypothetical protein